MFGSWEATFLDLAAEILDRITNRGFEVCIGFDESRLAIARESEHVVNDKDLPIAVWPSADSNGWDANFLRN